jgi:hypothetical protein
VYTIINLKRMNPVKSSENLVSAEKTPFIHVKLRSGTRLRESRLLPVRHFRDAGVGGWLVFPIFAVLNLKTDEFQKLNTNGC